MIRSVVLVLAFVAGPRALAQEEAPPAPRPVGEDALRFEGGAFVIQGKVQKPEVVVVIKRESVDRSFNLDLDERFLDRIVTALSDAPF